MSVGNFGIECALMEVRRSHQDKLARRWARILKLVRRRELAPRLRSFFRLSFRLLGAVLGISLLSYLIFRTGPGVVWKQLHEVGWGVALIIVLGGIAQFIKTCAWRQAFTCDIAGLSWSHSFVGQLIADGMGQLGVAGKVLGEGMRISLVRREVPLSSALSAGAIDGGLHSFTAVLVTVSGISATLLLAPLPAAWRAYGLLLVAVLVATVILAAVAVTRRWHLVGNAIRTIGRLPKLRNWIRDKQSIIDSAEDNLLTFHDEAPAAFWTSLILNLLWHALAALEVYVILRFMGAKIALGGAFVVEGLTKMINLVGALNPGNFGTYEAGNMLIARIFGVTSTSGLTLALCRRARTLFWAGVGGLCISAMKRAEEPETIASRQTTQHAA